MLLRLLLLTLWWSTEAVLYEDHYAEIKRDFENKTAGEKPTWTAGIYDRFRGKSLDDLKAFLGASLDEIELTSFPMDTDEYSTQGSLPERFDAREKWPKCADLISIIKDQSNCGSCWAVSAASVMSDRTCIGSNGTTVKFLSDEELLSCCKACGNGCNGGSPHRALLYWMNTGIPTGGHYGSKKGCKPYTIPPKNKKAAKTPKCAKSCIKEYPIALNKDRYKANRVYGIVPGETNMMKQIYERGPVIAIFYVYTDFFHYKSGIYEHKKGKVAGMHAVRIIGWGKDGKNKYWLAANSWGTAWGERGYFRIKRGQNECSIERYSAAGEAKV